MEPSQLANKSLTALLGWLFYCWPVLLAAPFVPLDWRSAWDYLLAAKWGRIWPLPSALLPAFIPIARDWDQKVTSGPEGYRVGTLLVTIAVIQLYGLQRNNRDRITTEDRFADLFNEIEKGREQAEVGRTDLFDAIQGAREEAQNSFDALFGLFGGFSQIQAALGDSSPSRDQESIDLLKNDSRLKYDEKDEHFLEMLRDDYISWCQEFIADNPSIQPVLLGSLLTRCPLFTGLIGVSYNFGVDWTRAQKAFPIPEEDIRKWIENRMHRLDDGLRALLDDEIYPYLVKAIESSIRYGVHKSISDLVAGAKRPQD